MNGTRPLQSNLARMPQEPMSFARTGMVAALAATILCVRAQAAVNSVLLIDLPTPPPGFIAALPFGVGVGGWLPGQLPSQSYDLNADGLVDIEFSISDREGRRGPGAVNAILPLKGSLQILGAPYPPSINTPSGQAAPLLAGDIIGLDSASIFDPIHQVQWAGVDFKNGMFDMLFQPVREIGQPTFQYGTFVGQEIYLGFRLLEEDGWHYGRMRMSGDQFFGLVVHEYAYETEPNVPILASRAIPEPTVLWLLGLLGGWQLMKRPASGSSSHSKCG
jgi:hypothetical protein